MLVSYGFLLLLTFNVLPVSVVDAGLFIELHQFLRVLESYLHTQHRSNNPAQDA